MSKESQFVINRWMENEDFQNFLRQMHVDCYVAWKNGVSDAEVQATVAEFARKIVESIPTVISE